eukprot:TRINITY_DN6822_c0_g1_i1.p1 TRINITY_DN6822_c0_g1~~TRINITY_DN6822_c0_g1_i1.p1  ORF type:complete len:280 (+),score=68.57 TRINITY_DN6822_c0_g1_i1:52-840(+)
MGGCFAKTFPLKQDTMDFKTATLYLTEEELKLLYREYVRFSMATDPLGVPEKMEDEDLPQEECMNDDKVWQGDEGEKGTKLLRMQQFLLMPWFNCNPFAPRIYKAFKDQKDGMTLDAFVVLASCLNPKAPPHIKHLVAYRLFDFDDNGSIREDDIRTLLEITTGLRDLWTTAAEDSLFEDPVGPLVRPGWPKGSFPTPGFPRSVISNEELPNLRQTCFDMAHRIYMSTNIENKTELSLADFSKVLSHVPDLQKRYSVKLMQE